MGVVDSFAQCLTRCVGEAEHPPRALGGCQEPVSPGARARHQFDCQWRCVDFTMSLRALCDLAGRCGSREGEAVELFGID
jgi:hypothetical protein